MNPTQVTGVCQRCGHYVFAFERAARVTTRDGRMTVRLHEACYHATLQRVAVDEERARKALIMRPPDDVVKQIERSRVRR